MIFGTQVGLGGVVKKLIRADSDHVIGGFLTLSARRMNSSGLGNHELLLSGEFLVGMYVLAYFFPKMI